MNYISQFWSFFSWRINSVCIFIHVCVYLAPEDEEGGEEKAPTGLTFAKWRSENSEAVKLPGTVTSGEISDFLWD